MFDKGSGSVLVMSSRNGPSGRETSKNAFWKKSEKNVPGSIKPVYGAQYPPRHVLSEPGTPTKQGKGSKNKNDSFKDFQDNTSDAWDDGDDDLITMANVKMNIKDVHATAMQVINNHSQEQARKAEENSPTNTPNSPKTSDPLPALPPGQRGYGPGMGVRVNTHYKPPTGTTPLQFKNKIPDREATKLDKFKSLLQSANLNMEDLKKICWSGIPQQYRPTAWKILSGYLPSSLDRRQPTLERKRQEYYNFIEQYYDTRLEEPHSNTFRQISIDIPRMSPLIPIFQQPIVQEAFARILFIWAIRHPASGYVQGINDLVTPFYVVFLTEYISNGQFVIKNIELDNCDLNELPSDQRMALEADSFWCFSKLLDGIQDNYTFAQPGIQLKVNALKELTSRIDNNLHQHLEKQNVEYLQFSFRWMNNLLMREVPLRCIIRLWDTCLCEPDGFATFHLYICAAFLTRFTDDLQREKDFQGLLLMLQNLPTWHWTDEEIGLVLAEAYKLKYMFADAPNHLAHKS